MQVTKASYSRRFNLGDYQHEDLSCEVALEVSDKNTADEAMKLARKTCVENSTKYLEAMKAKQKEGAK